MAEKKTPVILLVDDDQEVLDMYGEILKDAGYSVEFAKHGEEALQMCEKKKYDLILLDLMMPVMDGIECLKRLRADEGKYGHPVVVALTNVTMAVNVREAFENGADGYLVKLSVSNDMLVEKVAGYLKGFKQSAPEATPTQPTAVDAATPAAAPKGPEVQPEPEPEPEPPAKQ